MKRLLALTLVLALCLPLAGCWEDESAEPEEFWEIEEPEAPVAEEIPEEKIFTLAYLSRQTLDPIACSDGTQQVIGSLLYEGLFRLDEHFTAQNALCSSYARSGNQLTYTFTLREGAVFTDGSAVTPADVLFTYRRAKASERYAARFANILSMRTGRGTFIVTLSHADSALPALLDIPIVKSGTEKNAVPLGSGPYRFSSDESGFSLVHNEAWWNDGSGLPPRIALSPAKDADTAAYLFSASKAHLFAADLLSNTPAASLGGVDVSDADTTTMCFLGFNVKNAALADKTLRAAMTLAFDREVIVSTLLAGHAHAAQFPISPASPLYPAALETPFDPDAYVAALDARSTTKPGGTSKSAAVVTPPAPVELRLLANEESTFKKSLAEYLAKALTASYVTVTPVVLPWAEYLDALERKDFDLWLGETRLTADWNLTPLIGSKGALNYGGYVDALTDTALAQFLVNENETTSAAFCQRLTTEAPILALAFKTTSVLTPAGLIDGVSPSMTQPLRSLEDWTFHFDE